MLKLTVAYLLTLADTALDYAWACEAAKPAVAPHYYHVWSPTVLRKSVLFVCKACEAARPQSNESVEQCALRTATPKTHTPSACANFKARSITIVGEGMSGNSCVSWVRAFSKTTAPASVTNWWAPGWAVKAPCNKQQKHW